MTFQELHDVVADLRRRLAELDNLRQQVAELREQIVPTSPQERERRELARLAALPWDSPERSVIYGPPLEMGPKDSGSLRKPPSPEIRKGTPTLKTVDVGWGYIQRTVYE